MALHHQGHRSGCILASALAYSIKLLAFSALTLLVGRQEEQAACKKTEWWGAGVVICLDKLQTCI